VSSIVDVARQAGVSITTVSRVLNPKGDYPVATATRERVMAAAAALQYSPSALARALVTRRSHIVGALVSDIVDPYFAELVGGLEEVARSAGYLVIVCTTSRDPEIQRRYIATLRDYHADALILFGGEFVAGAERRLLDRELERAARQGAVAVAVAGEHAGLGTIDVDQRRAAADMTSYLIQLGHRRIAFIAGPRRVSTVPERLRGFVDAMLAAGLEPDLIADSDFSYDGGQRATVELLRRQPTAIFAANDQMALGALAASHAAGLSVPAELSVVGFGDTMPARHAVPALTTVFMPRHRLGAEAMQAVLVALETGRTQVEPRCLPHRLVYRSSSAPPASAPPWESQGGT
jgi:LacI family transcriptional regulator